MALGTPCLHQGRGAGHDTNTGLLCTHQERTDSRSAINAGSGETAPQRWDEWSGRIAFIWRFDRRCCHAPSLLSRGSPLKEALGERAGIFQNYFLLCLPSMLVQHLLSVFRMAPGSSTRRSPRPRRVMECWVCTLPTAGPRGQHPNDPCLPARSLPSPSRSRCPHGAPGQVPGPALTRRPDLTFPAQPKSVI